MKRHIAILLVLIFAFCMTAKPASANITSYSSEKTAPNFTSCLNPQGTVIADYPDGIHGIAGNQNTFTGSDKVFKDQSTGAVTQCFCPTNGQGMQTNWMKAENFSQDDIKTYESQGWVYIPVGSDWGLDPAPYLAQNSSFSCLATAIVESTSVATATSASSNGSTNTNNSSASNNNNNPITSLANTGNVVFIYSVLGLGIISLTAGILLRKLSKSRRLTK